MSENSNAGHEQRRVPLSQLFLDPNNYRFIDEANYVEVGEEKVFDLDVQRRTTGFILGERQANVRDLLDSFRKNGWLPVDQIQVREVGPQRYLVVEGNRRVAALKHLERQYQNASVDLGSLDPAIFHGVPVNLYTEADQVHHMVLMGLKHVSGNKKWPAYNQACMMRDLHEGHGQSAEDIVKALGISRREFNLSQNALAICDLYRESDYGDQFRSERYNLFREIVKSPDLREWLGWDYQQHRAANRTNLERLFAWISTTEEGGEENEEDGGRKVTLEPIITTGYHVRELTELIGDPIALKNLEVTRSLSEATLSSGKVIKDRVKETLDRMEAGSRTLLSMASHADENVLGRVDDLIRVLQGLQFVRGQAPRVVIGIREPEPFNKVRKGHFGDLVVERYRGLAGLRLEDLRRINVVAGLNNAGKTSVLEAVYLLTQQNDVDALFEVMQRRARMSDLRPDWVYQQAPEDAALRGLFDGMSASVEIMCEKDESELEDVSNYLGTIKIKASFGDQRQTSSTHLFFGGDRTRKTRREGRHVLCQSILSSPFSQHDPNVLARLYEHSVEGKTKEEVIEFLRRTVDGGIENIELVSDLKRFLVTHRDMRSALDLSSFGEGMQRIFHIGLLFSWARDGIVLIDELENAIHASLLVDFARLLQDLAKKFNTQVFVTTHSKECIDAFVYAGEDLDDVGYYSLKREGTGTRSEHLRANELARMLEVADVDIRRVR